MTIPANDPRWKVASAAEVDQLASDVTAAAANLKALITRANAIQAEIERQMGGEFGGMAKLIKPMRMLEEASEKVDQASWALTDFAAKFHKVSL